MYAQLVAHRRGLSSRDSFPFLLILGRDELRLLNFNYCRITVITSDYCRESRELSLTPKQTWLADLPQKHPNRAEDEWEVDDTARVKGPSKSEPATSSPLSTQHAAPSPTAAGTTVVIMGMKSLNPEF